MDYTGATVAELGEQGLLDYLKQRFRERPDGVHLGIGDDAAVLDGLSATVLTTDCLVEGVHFDLGNASWNDVGHRAAAVNLSDLAAMGARPRGLLLSLTLRRQDRMSQFVDLVDGLVDLGGKYGAPLIGGDLSRTEGPLIVNVVALGEPAGEYILRRSTGRPGDQVYCTGTFAASVAGLHLLRQGHRRPETLVERHLRPEPRLAVGGALSDLSGVTACADTSDGLARDTMLLPHPGAGLRLDVASIPIAQGVDTIAAELGCPAWKLALTGGEDFELVFSVAEGAIEVLDEIQDTHRVKFSRIGEIKDEPGLELVGAGDGIAAAGFDHFL